MTKKISALPAIGTLAGTEQFEVAFGGVSSSATANQIGAFTRDVSLPWIDIRDYGTIVQSSNITSALNAAMADYPAGHTRSVILIPALDTGNPLGTVYTIDGSLLTIPTSTALSWTWMVAAGINVINAPITLAKNMHIKGLTVQGQESINQGGFPGAQFNVPNATATHAFLIQDGGNTLENLWITVDATGNDGIYMDTAANVIIRDCIFQCEGSGHPLVIDGCFWIEIQRCWFQARAAGDKRAVFITCNSGADASGLITMDQCRVTRTGIEIKPITSPVPNGIMQFRNIISEGIFDGESLFILDSSSGTADGISGISFEWGGHADKLGDGYLVKNVGLKTRQIFFNGMNSNSMTAFFDPVSTPIDGLTVYDKEGSFNFIPDVTHYTGTDFQDALCLEYKASIETKLLSAPIGMPWVIGTPVVIDQDGTTWAKDVTLTVTGGKLAPDGSSMAFEITGTGTIKFNDANRTLAVGDWLIAGIWVRSTIATTTIFDGGNTNLGLEILTAGFDVKPHLLNDVDVAKHTSSGWRWLCRACRVNTIGTNPCGVRFQMAFTAQTYEVFNPSMQIITDASGIDDNYVINYVKSLQGGWSPNATAPSAARAEMAFPDHQIISIGATRTPLAAEKTIATGVVAITGGYHLIDTEADGATDDLDTINGGLDGMRLVIRASNSARTVVAKDATGNLQLAGDCTLDNAQDTLELIFDSALNAWLEIGRSDNGA